MTTLVVIGLVLAGLVIVALAALLAAPADLVAAGVVVGPGECPAGDCDWCCCGTPGEPVKSGAAKGAEVAGPEQLAFVGPLLVCIVCDRVRTRPGHWVAGGSAPFGGVDAIRRAGKAEECVCKWCASMQRERLAGEVKAVAV